MKKRNYIIGGIAVSLLLIYFFAPPLVDFSGKGSKYNQWKNRNKPTLIKTVAVTK